MSIANIIGNAYDIPEGTPHFGIELEVENGHQPGGIESTLWHTVHDGSLRNNGIEFLSVRPMTKQEVRDNVPIFYQWMEAYRFDTNIRTSTHVHVNVLGMSPAQVAAASIVYTLVEPMMFRFCGRLREENIYCVPWYRATSELELVGGLARGNTNMLGMSCKYSAMYLEPVTRFGTLEFRQAPVFDTPGQLLTWVDMCERVVYSGFDTIEEVLETFEELSANEFVEGIFGADITEVLRGICEYDFEELMELYDVETTAEMALACTYKPTEWFTPQFEVEGEGTVGYHMTERQDPMYGGFEDLPHDVDEDYYEDDYEEDE